MEATCLRYIDGREVRVWAPEGGTRLRAEIEGDRTILCAVIRRCFPQSQPDGYLSLQEENGTEVGVIRHISELDQSSQEVVRVELDRRYFTPKITRIHSCEQDAGMWLFDVDTQRGRAGFYVRSWRDSAHEIGPGRLQILSVDGQRFEIEDFDALDRASQRFLEQLG